MRSFDENDKYDRKELANLRAPSWMLPLLKLNPGYCHWGPGEDYMDYPKEGEESKGGWRSSVVHETWADSAPMLDELNEVVNFYFAIERAAKPCEACDQSGSNPETKKISDDFYGNYMESDPNRWCDKITQDEADALVAGNRLHDLTSHYVAGEGWVKNDPPTPVTAEMVNALNRQNAPRGMGFMQHDAINRWILVETRAKRLGVYGKCQECGGEGHIYTEPEAKLQLTLWVLHPRKGASRGWLIKDVKQTELPEVFAFLKQAADRNAERFAKVVAEVGP